MTDPFTIDDPAPMSPGMRYPRWTNREDAVLREVYAPARKPWRFLAIHEKLPGRSKDAVTCRVKLLGIAKREMGLWRPNSSGT